MPGVNKDWDNKVILFKLETTEGTDAVPTSAANAFRVLNFTPTFMDADQKVRNIEKAYFGADPVAMAAFKRGCSFDMEIHGGGTGTTVPPWMTMLRVAGFAAPTTSSFTSIFPATSNTSTATGYWYIDDLLMIAIGGRASVGFKIEDDEYPMFSFKYLGRPPAAALASQATPTAPTITGYIDPLLCSSQNTTFSLDGFALSLRRWTMDANADLQFRSLIGPQDRVNLRDRSWSGEIVAEIPDLTTKEYFSRALTGATMVAQCVQGVAAGNMVTINCPRLQVSGNIALSEEQGKAMMTIPVTALPSNGNDEISFVSA